MEHKLAYHNICKPPRAYIFIFKSIVLAQGKCDKSLVRLLFMYWVICCELLLFSSLTSLFNYFTMAQLVPLQANKLISQAPTQSQWSFLTLLTPKMFTSMEAPTLLLKISLELRGQLLIQPKDLSKEANNLHTLETNRLLLQCSSKEARYLPRRGHINKCGSNVYNNKIQKLWTESIVVTDGFCLKIEANTVILWS